MSLTTETFNFADIIDDAEVAPVAREEFENKNTDRGQSIDDLNPIPTEELDEEEESPEEVEETSDEETEEVEETDDSDEGEEVDFDDYEIVLPSGEETTLAELVSGYRDNKALEAEKAEFERTRQEFLDNASFVTDYMEASKMEADSIIEDYKDFDWAGLKRSNPEEYIAHKDYYEDAVNRKATIQAKMEQKRADEEAKASRQKQVDAQNCNATLVRDIPGWGSNLFNNLYTYAVENGVPEEDLQNNTDPVYFKLLHKAMQFDKGAAKAKASVKKIGSPTKVVKSEGNNKPQPVNAGKLINNYGKLSKSDKATVFANLKD